MVKNFKVIQDFLTSLTIQFPIFAKYLTIT